MTFYVAAICSYISNICSRHCFFMIHWKWRFPTSPMLDHGLGRSGPIYLKSWPLVTLYLYIYLYLSEIDPILSQHPGTNFLCPEIDVDVSGSFVFCHFRHVCHFRNFGHFSLIFDHIIFYAQISRMMNAPLMMSWNSTSTSIDTWVRTIRDLCLAS